MKITGQDLLIEKATVKDAEAIVKLVNYVYRGDEALKGWTTEAHFLGGQRIDAEGVLEVIERRDAVILTFRRAQGEPIVACVQLEKHAYQCYLGMLTVDLKLQNAGFGKIILKASEEFAKQTWGCGEMYMSVISIRTELIEFYKRRGYVITGQTKPFPYGNSRFGLPQRDDLYFEILKKPIQI